MPTWIIFDGQIHPFVLAVDEHFPSLQSSIQDFLRQGYPANRPPQALGAALPMLKVHFPYGPGVGHMVIYMDEGNVSALLRMMQVRGGSDWIEVEGAQVVGATRGVVDGVNG